MVFGHIGRQMAAAEIEEFLRSAGHGLLSLARDDVAYGIPMSYAYERETQTFVMEFLFQTESKKRRFIVGTEEASLCVYDWEGRDDWQSVIAGGPLERVEDDGRIRDMASLLAQQCSDVAPWWLRFSDNRQRDHAWYVLRAMSLEGYCAD